MVILAHSSRSVSRRCANNLFLNDDREVSLVINVGKECQRYTADRRKEFLDVAVEQNVKK